MKKNFKESNSKGEAYQVRYILDALKNLLHEVTMLQKIGIYVIKQKH